MNWNSPFSPNTLRWKFFMYCVSTKLELVETFFAKFIFLKPKVLWIDLWSERNIKTIFLLGNEIDEAAWMSVKTNDIRVPFLDSDRFCFNILSAEHTNRNFKIKLARRNWQLTMYHFWKFARIPNQFLFQMKNELVTDSNWGIRNITERIGIGKINIYH